MHCAYKSSGDWSQANCLECTVVAACAPDSRLRSFSNSPLVNRAAAQLQPSIVSFAASVKSNRCTRSLTLRADPNGSRSANQRCGSVILRPIVDPIATAGQSQPGIFGNLPTAASASSKMFDRTCDDRLCQRQMVIARSPLAGVFTTSRQIDALLSLFDCDKVELAVRWRSRMESA